MDSKIANDDYKVFGDKLRDLRESTGLSQTAFAMLFGMLQQTYQVFMGSRVYSHSLYET
jgi:transcriptional regulator with XRE-family HTH domain